jgi:hypothetical protein
MGNRPPRERHEAGRLALTVAEPNSVTVRSFLCQVICDSRKRGSRLLMDGARRIMLMVPRDVGAPSGQQPGWF